MADKPGKHALHSGALIQPSVTTKPAAALKAKPVGVAKPAATRRAGSTKPSAAPQTAWLAYRDGFLTQPLNRQIDAIRQGAPAAHLVGVAETLGIPREQVYALAGLPASTAKRKLSQNETLDPLVTERLTRLGTIEKLAEETFGDRARASTWLQTRNLGLGDVAPLSLLDTEIGCREVMRVLNAIAYGGAA